MVGKSIEAFTLSIETFNKPTINYRVEAFGYLICNSWELLLKAYLIETKGKESIYYRDNPSRTINLDTTVKSIFTNETDPLRVNLESIIELRNISTHFITQEYENVYAPLFQACVNNYIDKIDQFFDVNILDYIRFPFLVVPTYHEEITPSSFKRRYGKEVFVQYMKTKNTITDYIEQNPNDKYALGVNISTAIVKDLSKADVKVGISKDSSEKVTIINKVKDVNTSFPYNQKRALENINKQLSKSNSSSKLNSYSFQLICSYFKLYDDTSMCYLVRVDMNPRKMFSNKLVDFIVNEVRKDSGIVNSIKSKLKEKTANPRSKGF